MFKNRTILITNKTRLFHNTVTNQTLPKKLHEGSIFLSDKKNKDKVRKKYSKVERKIYINSIQKYFGITKIVNNIFYVTFKQSFFKINAPSANSILKEAVENMIALYSILFFDKKILSYSASSYEKEIWGEQNYNSQNITCPNLIKRELLKLDSIKKELKTKGVGG